jgi:hypothetical protein
MLLIPLAAAVGCAKGTPEAGPAADTSAENTAVVETSGEDDHGGWWCAPHGVPEGECGICNAKLAAEFQRNGDWCKEHDRPDSQCFVCHPELEAAFAGRYEAKYGKAPPKPQG